MATNENIRVVQLTDDNDNPVSPVVNVGSLYDKNGNKVDNLLSYKLAGTTQTIPEVKDLVKDVNDKLATAGHAIGDVVQNVIGPLDDTWLPCDGRIIDSSIPLYSKMSMVTLDDTRCEDRWINLPGSDYVSQSYTSYSGVIDGSLRNLGDVIYSIDGQTSTATSVSVSFDYGKTFATFASLKPSDSRFSYNLQFYNVYGKLLIVRTESISTGGTASMDYCVIDNSTSGSLSWISTCTVSEETANYTARTDCDVTCICNRCMHCVITTTYRSSTKRRFLVKIHVDNPTHYDVWEITSAVSDFVFYNSDNSYSELVFMVYDTEKSNFVFGVTGLKNNSYNTSIFKSVDLKSFTTCINNPGRSIDAFIAAAAIGGKISVIYEYRWSSTTQIATIVGNYETGEFTDKLGGFGSSSTAITDGSLIVGMAGSNRCIMFDKKSGRYSTGLLPNKVNTAMIASGTIVQSNDEAIYISSGNGGTLLFDMKNKRLPYIPGSYIKVK